MKVIAICGSQRAEQTKIPYHLIGIFALIYDILSSAKKRASKSVLLTD